MTQIKLVGTQENIEDIINELEMEDAVEASETYTNGAMEAWMEITDAQHRLLSTFLAVTDFESMTGTAVELIAGW